MDSRFTLIKVTFIVLGIISIILGKYLPVKIMMPKPEKYKIIDEKNYIKSVRIIFFCLGFYYIIVGIILLLINGWPSAVGIFTSIVPALIIATISRSRRKYIKLI